MKRESLILENSCSSSREDGEDQMRFLIPLINAHADRIRGVTPVEAGALERIAP